MKNLLYTLMASLLIVACSQEKEEMSSLRVESNCKECFERTVLTVAYDTISDTTINKGKFCTEEEIGNYSGVTSVKDRTYSKYIIRSCK